MSNFWPAPLDVTPLSIGGGKSELGDIAGAASEQMRLVDNTNAAYEALDQAYRDRIDGIKKATGIELANPLVPQWTAEDAAAADRAAAQPGLPDPAAPTQQRDQVVARQQREFEARLAELATQFPQHAGTIKATTPVARDAETLAQQADAKLGTLLAAHPGWDGSVASFAGGALGSFRDPLVLGSLLVGGGPGGARTVVGQILETGAREALLNGGVAAASQPAVQEWRRQAGLPHGFDQAAQNVLFAAGFGAGFGVLAKGGAEAVRGILGKVRPALSAEARGGLDAAEQLQALEEVKPAAVSPARHDAVTAAADRATRERTPIAAPDAPDQVEVNRIVNALAPAPESIGGEKTAPGPAEIDALAKTLADPGKAAMAQPTPVLDHLRQLGGVDPASPAAEELKAAGVNARSVYRKGGLKALDNLPHDELPADVRHTIAQDGNGYADQNALMDAASAEANGYGGGRSVEDLAGERAFYERQGVDFSADPATVRAQLSDVVHADRRYAAAAASDETVSVPAGLSRRQHTEQLVHETLKLQPGLPADQVRHAVNLSLFENVPIAEAVDSVMSDAAGVSRTTTPEGGFADLGTTPAALLEEPAIADEEAIDFKAELEAMKELGFTGGVLPGGGEDLVSIADLEQSIKNAAALERLVELCRV